MVTNWITRHTPFFRNPIILGISSIKFRRLVHPRKLTWNLKMPPWKRKTIFQTSIFGFYVNFRGWKRWSFLGGKILEVRVAPRGVKRSVKQHDRSSSSWSYHHPNKYPYWERSNIHFYLKAPLSRCSSFSQGGICFSSLEGNELCISTIHVQNTSHLLFTAEIFQRLLTVPGFDNALSPNRGA